MVDTPKQVGGKRIAGERSEGAQKARTAAINAIKTKWGVSEFVDIFPTNIRPDGELGDTAISNLRAISRKEPNFAAARLLMSNECVDNGGRPVRLGYKHTKNILNKLAQDVESAKGDMTGSKTSASSNSKISKKPADKNKEDTLAPHQPSADDFASLSNKNLKPVVNSNSEKVFDQVKEEADLNTMTPGSKRVRKSKQTHSADNTFHNNTEESTIPQKRNNDGSNDVFQKKLKTKNTSPDARSGHQEGKANDKNKVTEKKAVDKASDKVAANQADKNITTEKNVASTMAEKLAAYKDAHEADGKLLYDPDRKIKISEKSIKELTDEAQAKYVKEVGMKYATEKAAIRETLKEAAEPTSAEMKATYEAASKATDEKVDKDYANSPLSPTNSPEPQESIDRAPGRRLAQLHAENKAKARVRNKRAGSPETGVAKPNKKRGPKCATVTTEEEESIASMDCISVGANGAKIPSATAYSATASGPAAPANTTSGASSSLPESVVHKQIYLNIPSLLPTNLSGPIHVAASKDVILAIPGEMSRFIQGITSCIPASQGPRADLLSALICAKFGEFLQSVEQLEEQLKEVYRQSERL